MPSSLRAESTAAELLDKALTPSQAYSGTIELSQWLGTTLSSETITIRLDPQHGYRREFLLPNNHTDRILTSDGKKETLYLVRQKKVLTGTPIQSSSKRLHQQQQMELLRSNYDAALDGDASLLGRVTHILVLTPKSTGKPHQKFWIDDESSVILQSERYLPEGGLASRMRFTRFEPEAQMDPSLFDVSPKRGMLVDSHGLDPDFLSLEELRKRTGKQAVFPLEMPGGFIFESGDTFDLQKSSVLCVRYTDGLTDISIFQTVKPVKVPKNFRSLALGEGFNGTLGATAAHHVIHWRSGKRYYTLIGEISMELMEQIAKRIP